MTVFKVDLDIPRKAIPPEWLKFWLETRLFIFARFGIQVLDVEVRESEHGNIHVLFYSPQRLDDWDICMIQFLLGDDTKRVLMNMKRLALGVEEWNVLFTEGA